MFGWFVREDLSINRTCGDAAPTSRRWWLSLAVVCACAGVAKTAAAEDPECTYKQILSRGEDKAASVKTDDTIRSYEHELELCRGRVSISDQHRTLLYIVRQYLKKDPTDFEGCRRVTERSMLVVGNGGPDEEINDSFGYCGGDCKKAACMSCCEFGVKKRQKEIEDDVRRAQNRDRTVEDRDSEQAVSCDFKKARELVTKLDKAAFRDSALRLITKYRRVCGKEITSDVAEALTNDEAMVNYHRGDDALCVKGLSGLPTPDSTGTAFNRALCGGPCSLGATKCATANEARRNAIAARAAQSKLRAQTLAWCSSHPPDEDRGLPAWDLTGTTAWKGNPTGERDGRIVWAGDINGDGLGDLVFGWDGRWEDLSSSGLNGYGLPTVRWNAFSVTIGCGRLGDYREILGRNTELNYNDPQVDLEASDVNTSVGVVERPGSAIRSVCIYPTRKVMCTRTKCNSKPEECADLSDWEKAEGATLKQ